MPKNTGYVQLYYLTVVVKVVRLVVVVLGVVVSRLWETDWLNVLATKGLGSTHLNKNSILN